MKLKVPEDPQRHAVGEGALADRIHQQDGGGGCHWGAVGHGDPGAHSQAVAQLPFTAHPAEDADQEVEDDQLVGTAVIEPLIDVGSGPDRIEVQADGVGAGHHRSGDDVVAVEQTAGDRLADAVDVDGGSTDEGEHEAAGGHQQGGNHQHPEPAHVEAVVGGGDPLAELLPRTRCLFALKN